MEAGFRLRSLSWGERRVRVSVQGLSNRDILENDTAAQRTTSAAPACHSDWRCTDHYAYLQGMDRAGWAWEWLRRNPGYQQDVEQHRLDRRCTM